MTTPRRSCSGAATLLLLGAFRLLATAEAAAGTDLSSLPWDDLRAALSEDASLVETGPADYVDQCLPVFPLAEPDLSHYGLLNQPAGVCMNQAFCGFKNCNPFAHDTDLTILQIWEKMFDSAVLPTIEDVDNPSYNVPNYVLFPSVASDVHAAVAFANTHKIEMSIKNSGHSYTGASTKADTLHINMNHYRHYASEEDSEALVECDDEVGQSTDPTLAEQPCKLAMSRGKVATLRVGGGENFDKVYRAVKTWNEANGYKHHVVGGAAGTVSPMGWSWQGGLSGTTNGRTFGFGVDQVLQIEAVLPLGHHVRFGATEWEDAEGFAYPRTTKVEGVCNSNPAGDESEWVWGPCTDPIDFDGLWFAIRGGGGGTYGLITSIQLQLHEYLPLKTFQFGSGVFYGQPCNLGGEGVFGALGNAAWEFILLYFHKSSELGVSVEDSELCAAPAFAPYSVGVWCYGNGADIMLTSWKKFLSDRSQALVEAGVSPASIETAASCIASEAHVDYADANARPKEDVPYAGQAKSYPLPMYPSSTEFFMNVLIPTKYILENMAQVISWINPATVSEAPPIYLAFGGGLATAHDQANSLSKAHRDAGVMLFLPHSHFDETWWTSTFPAMYPDAAVEGAGSSFPGFLGSNHAGPNSRGPTKDDWTKPCDLNWTEEERDDRCVSLQEAIWGTERLARLEAIKDAVDPNGLLDCNGCVGNNRQKKKTECDVPYVEWIGDGYCDVFDSYNTAECGFDGGDCCAETCTDGDYQCGVEFEFDCKDPAISDA